MGEAMSPYRDMMLSLEQKRLEERRKQRRKDRQSLRKNRFPMVKRSQVFLSR